MTARRPQSRLGRARYRVRQVTLGLRPQLEPREIAEVRTLLSDQELALFAAMEPRDCRHSVDLLHRLRDDAAARGDAPPHALLVAALLHDVGKGPLRTWHRVAFVLLGGLPGIAARIEREHGAGCQRALWRLRHHARLGAERLREAGCDPRVIDVVAAHTSAAPSDDPEVARFIALDDRA